jgi:hypothetical protein
VTLKIHWTSEADASASYRALGMQEVDTSGVAELPLSWVRKHAVRAVVMVSATAYLAWRLCLFVLASALHPASTVDLLLDDAYYYLQIAYNFAHHGQMSFDGITSTNGYQPAWMLLWAAIETVLRLDKKELFVAMVGLTFLLMAGPLLYSLRRHRDAFHLSLAAGLLAAYGWYPGVFVSGLETALVAPAFAAIAISARHGLRASAKRASFLFAFVVMIRLDAASMLVAYTLPLAFGWWRTAGLQKAALRTLRFVAPSAVTLAAYALFNWLCFDTPVPVSGMAKGIGAPHFTNWGILHHYLFQSVPLLITGALLLLVELVWTKFRGESARFTYAGMGIATLGMVVHYLYFASFSGWIPWPWYFYGYGVIVAMMTARLVAIAMERMSRPVARRPYRVQVIALGAAFLGTFVVPAVTHGLITAQVLENEHRGGVPDGSFNRRNVADAMALAERGETMTVAIGDRAAGLGYWAPDNVRVFAMEGLVSDRAYLDARQHDRGEAWVRDVIKPRFLVVDREDMSPVRIGDEERYVVIEPIQGRVVLDHFITYCFRKESVVRQIRGRDDQIVVLPAPAVRTTFDMSMAEPCTGAFADYVKAQIFAEDSLRRSGVAAEYAPEIGGDLSTALERFDRKLALRRFAAAQTK